MDVDIDGASMDVEFDMTGGWVYTCRIFGGDEKRRWEDQLSEVRAAPGQPADGTLVGAQWRPDEESMVEPPDEFDTGVKYRPIFLTEYIGIGTDIGRAPTISSEG